MAPKLHPVCRSLGDESRGHRGEAGRLAPDPCGVPCFIAPAWSRKRAMKPRFRCSYAMCRN